MSPALVDFIGGPCGKHALIGASERGISQHWWTPLTVLLSVSAVFLSLGWLQKAHCVRTAATSTGQLYIDWSGNRQFTSACYSDTIGLFSTHGLDQLHFPYFSSLVDDHGISRYMEYPVLTGLYQWCVAVIARPVEYVWFFFGAPAVAPGVIYFAVNAFFLALAWMLTVVFLTKLTGKRLWDTLLVAASPLIIVHAFTNFDILPVFTVVVGLWAWSSCKPAWSGVAFGLGVALKLWPLFVVVALAFLCIRLRRWAVLLRVLSAMVLAWLAVNLPFMLFAPRGWLEFFRINAQRGWEGSTMYAVVAHILGHDDYSGVNPQDRVAGVEALNGVVFVFLLACMIGVAWLVIVAAPTVPRVGQVAFLATLAFMVTSKVWSPQYSLWLVALLALALPRWRLVFAWSAWEMVYWYVRMWQFLPAEHAAPNWLADTMTVIRLGLLLAMAGLVVAMMCGRMSDPVRLAHGGKDPLAGVFAIRQ